MHFTQLIALVASATTALAAPAPASIHVTADDVVLTGKGGRFEVMKRSEFEKLVADDLALSHKPAHLETDYITYTGPELANITSNHLSKREVSVIIPGKKDYFLGWDVQVSEIVKGGPGTKVHVSTGISVSNSVSVKVGVDLSIVKDFLKTSMDITQTWETSETQTQTLMTDVPEGKWGCWVHQAWTNRQYGQIWKGTVGSPGEISDFMADSYVPKANSRLQWIDGFFSPCFSDQFPMPRCHGEGFL